MQTPRIYVDDYFKSLQNQIDIRAETILNEYRNDANVCEQVNLSREDMVKELKKMAQGLLVHVTSGYKDSQDLKRRISLMDQKVSEIFETKSEKLDVNHLEDVYEKLVLEIIDETERFETWIFNNQSFAFIEPSNNQPSNLGFLVHIEDQHFTQHELDGLK